ncbi:MAG: short chain dehydrogenase [Saprospiraceae bacterium]|nr:short chain dehydrogenase [Saprospiraceae bacterium]
MDKKRILLIGATGTIGSYLADRLKTRHELILASKRRSPVQVDITSSDSIRGMYEQLGRLDAVIITAGNAYFGDFRSMKEEDFYVGIRSKMMGQINTVMLGRDHLNPGGSFTVTTGILADDPIRQGLGLSMVNGALHAFVQAAAIELAAGIRINAVCPGLVEPSRDKYGPYFAGHFPVPMEKVYYGYLKSLEGARSGEIIRIYS